MFSEKVNFKESIIIDPVTGQQKKEYILSARIVPFEEISRNGYMYNKESLLDKHESLVSRHLMFNHKTNGTWDESKPRGEWIETWVENKSNPETDGVYGKAKVYDVSYNKEFIEFLQAASEPRVSLNVNGRAESRQSDDGTVYQEAFVEEFLESSIVAVPGFDCAKSTFAMEMMQFNESYKEENETEFWSQLLQIIKDWGLLFSKLGITNKPEEPKK